MGTRSGQSKGTEMILGKTVMLARSITVSDIAFDAVIEDDEGMLWDAEVSEAVIHLRAGSLLVVTSITRDHIEAATVPHGIPVPIQLSDLMITDQNRLSFGLN
jgi:hypothetical protein